MADEPRRSGRATKGVPKERDADDKHVPKKGKGKGAKAKAVEEEEDEENEIIRCVCGLYEEEEDVPRAMICCDSCSAWQHNDCMGLKEDYEPPKYFCEQCRPNDHKELLAAMKRGEKPWEEAARVRQIALAEAAAKKKGGRKSKKSMDGADEGLETPVTDRKRKAEESPAVLDTKSTKRARGTPAADTNGKTATSRKPSGTPSRQPTMPMVQDPKELPQDRRAGGSSLVKLFIEHTKSAVKAGSFALPRDTTADAHGTRIGLLVEHAMYHVQSGGSGVASQAYKEQLRAITFNLKKNPTLTTSVLTSQTTPHALAAMDAKDMASEEQQAKDAAIMKEMERQHSMVEQQETGPRIRRTHKGDEYVDEESAARSHPASTSATRAPPRTEQDVKSPEIKSPIQASRRQPSVTIPRRQSSANFDINRVYSTVQTNQDGEQRFGELPTQPSGGPVREPVAPGAGADADIDALLKDEDADSEPYSPKDYADADDGTVWRGVINGAGLGRFATSARYAAGARPEDKTLKTTWTDLLPHEIGINGRIQPAKADEYLCGLEFSNSSDMLVIWMSEPPHEPDSSGFNKFFTYFKSKERFGVGAQHHQPALKDIYFIPMNAGEEMPTFVKKLDGDFPDFAQEQGLLVPLVVKNTELPHGGVLSPTVGGSGGPATQSPLVGGPGPSMQTPITPQYAHSPHPPYGAPPTNGMPHHTQPQFDNQPPTQQFSSPPPPYTSLPQPTAPHPLPHAPHQSSIPNAPTSQAPASLAASRILGPQLASAPAVLDLIASAPTAGDLEMNVIKECIAENPQAAQSLALLTSMLQERWGRQQAEQGGGNGQGDGVGMGMGS